MSSESTVVKQQNLTEIEEMEEFFLNESKKVFKIMSSDDFNITTILGAIFKNDNKVTITSVFKGFTTLTVTAFNKTTLINVSNYFKNDFAYSKITDASSLNKALGIEDIKDKKKKRHNTIIGY